MKRCVGRMLLIVGVILTTPPVAEAQLERSGSSEVSFTAYGPAGLTIVGKTPDLVVGDGRDALVLTVPLAAMTTGIGVRDRHMREDLEVTKFPKVELTVKRGDLKIPDPGQEVAADLEGVLDLHGESHPIKFHYSAKRDGSVHDVRAEMRVKMSDWGVKVPPYLGMNVKPDVDVSARFALADH